MFRLYLFYSDLRDVYNNTDDNESVMILDMAKKMFAGMSKEQLLRLRDDHNKVANYIEDYLLTR